MKQIVAPLALLSLAGCATAAPVAQAPQPERTMTVVAAISPEDVTGYRLMTPPDNNQVSITPTNNVIVPINNVVIPTNNTVVVPVNNQVQPTTTDLVTPNDLIRLNAGKIEVWLKRGSEAAVQVGQALPGTQRQLTLTNLRLNTTYQVLLKAYKDDPNDASTVPTLKMSDDGPSTTTFTTNADGNGAYDTRREETLALRLSDYTFAGKAAGNVSVTPGAFTSTTASEALEQLD